MNSEWLAQNWPWLACLAGAAWLMFGNSASGAMSKFKIPPIPVRIVKDETPPGA